VAFQELDPARRRAPPSERSLLWHVNAALARPIASTFGFLGVAPGLLSLQSFWLTIVGLVRMASGEWSHVVQGALIVYGGLLLDRADHLLSEAKGKPPAWGVFLGLLVDRLVDAALVVALGVLLAVGITKAPGALVDPWEFLPTTAALVLALGALATMLVWRLGTAYADVLYLRTHLLVIRRLPGPSIIPRKPQGVERLNRLFDRDLLVLAWFVGVCLAQVQLTIAVVLLAHLGALVESIILFWHRRKDPEPQASRILGREYP
jgi:ABC-type sugar transport system permease subunit